MRKKSNVTNGWKSTITGLVVLIVSLFYMIVAEPINFYVFVSGLIFGVLLLFSPDTLINKIEVIIDKVFTNNSN